MLYQLVVAQRHADGDEPAAVLVRDTGEGVAALRLEEEPLPHGVITLLHQQAAAIGPVQTQDEIRIPLEGQISACPGAGPAAQLR